MLNALGTILNKLGPQETKDMLIAFNAIEIFQKSSCRGFFNKA